MIFRGLTPDEIEVRVGNISAKGATLLLYKDARCDQNILDETFGAWNWQRDHKEVKGNLYAGVGIYDESYDRWVWKWDCGKESHNEKEKGEASDSFKRACFNWGIGRELYTAPLIFIKCPTKPKHGSGFELVDRYQFSGCKVTEIKYQETEHKRIIAALKIADGKGNVIYKYDSAGEYKGREKTTVEERQEMIDADELINDGAIDFITHLCIDTNTDPAAVCRNYNVRSFHEMKTSEFEDACRLLEKKLKKLQK